MTLRQILFLFAVLFLWRSILLTLRRIYFYSALHIGVDFGDLEANLTFIVLFLWRSILLTWRQIYFLQCSSYEGRFCWPWGKFTFYSALPVKVDCCGPWGTNLIFAVDHSRHSDSGLFGKLCLQIVHYMFLCVLQILFFPLEMVASIKNGLCETKHSPAWAMANMFPMWPQDSCFSLVVAGVGGLPLQVTWRQSATVVSPDRKNGPLELRNQLFSSRNSLFLFLFLEVFDYFVTLPITVHY